VQTKNKTKTKFRKLNMNNKTLYKTVTQIFQKGSQTYFWSSFFFPKAVFKKVSILYAFVRLFDDFVDKIPQDKPGFARFEKQYRKILLESKIEKQ
jgi:phytoene synthase